MDNNTKYELFRYIEELEKGDILAQEFAAILYSKVLAVKSENQELS